MKLNCDMGEGLTLKDSIKNNTDASIMPYVDMSNIACGFHASDPQIMSYTIDLAIQHNVTIGAHPSFPDRENFGRSEMQFSFDEVLNIVLYQLGAIQALCHSKNTHIEYVKPHGALYNMMMGDTTLFKAILSAVNHFSPKMPLVIMATPEHEIYQNIAKEFDTPILFEAFCDRAYTEEGLLQSRAEAGAVHKDINTIVEQAKQLIHHQQVRTCRGKILPVKADTLCIHGDSALAVESVKRIRTILQA